MTGATGFVGGATMRQAVAAGWHVRALTRRPQPERGGVTWIAGALDDKDSLAEMAKGADAVMHIAGVVNVPPRRAMASRVGHRRGARRNRALVSPRGLALTHPSSVRIERSRDTPDGKRLADGHLDFARCEWIVVTPSMDVHRSPVEACIAKGEARP